MRARGKIGAALVAAIGLTVTAGLTVVATGPAAGSEGHDRGWRHVSWIASGPPLSIGAPSCDATGHCAYPFTDSGTDAGDLQGSHAAAGGATADASGSSFGTTRMVVFTGSVRGCGHGTLAMSMQAITHPDGSTSEWWQVRTGFGAGDLANASGTGQGTLAAGSSDAHFSGFVRCHT
jgi:hypothetical protein